MFAKYAVLKGATDMSRITAGFCVLGLLLCAASPVAAGGIENKPNFSAEWIRTLNRNAATDSADIAVYNPAGTTRMGEGLYLNLSGQYAAKDYTNSVGGISYESDTPDMVPGLFAIYRKENWSLFGAFTIPVGGGKVDFERGSATSLGLASGFLAAVNSVVPPPAAYASIGPHHIEGESFYYGVTAGGAYRLSEMISVSLGARYAKANIERKGHATIIGSPVLPDRTAFLDYKEKDSGVCGIAGVNITPTERLNIGLRYESKTRLNLETEVKKDDLGLVANGDKRRRDIPAPLGAGVSYQLTPRLRAETNLTYYFNKQADWDDVPITLQDETQRGNGYDVGIAFEYECSPRFKWSVGYMYSDTKIDPDNMSIEAPELDAHTVGGGVAWRADDRWTLNGGVLRAFYKDETTSAGIKLEKDVWIFALGVQYKFF